MNADEWAKLTHDQRLKEFQGHFVEGDLAEWYRGIAFDAARRLEVTLSNRPGILSVSAAYDEARYLPLSIDRDLAEEEALDYCLVVNVDSSIELQELLGGDEYCGFGVVINTLGAKKKKYESDWGVLNKELLRLSDTEFQNWVAGWQDDLLGKTPVPFVYHEGVLKMFCQLVAERWRKEGVSEHVVVLRKKVQGLLGRHLVSDSWMAIDFEKSNVRWPLIRAELDQLRLSTMESTNN